ncbi:unnamed protein product [Thelazia callipaeda]|uniref:DUF4062 domain-containing protein n=1 Tax=Thelazia callipaeda TaxID=103827 RepID=A0A0N5CT69_THECL|nr:unnamed protein product [Thelazia callipaeda]
MEELKLVVCCGDYDLSKKSAAFLKKAEKVFGIKHMGKGIPKTQKLKKAWGGGHGIIQQSMKDFDGFIYFSVLY